MLQPCDMGNPLSCISVDDAGNGSDVYFILGGGRCTTDCPADTSVVDTRSYDRSCSADSDCAAPVPVACGCPTGAISVSAVPAYNAAIAAALRDTPQVGEYICWGPLTGYSAACVEGQCVLN